MDLWSIDRSGDLGGIIRDELTQHLPEREYRGSLVSKRNFDAWALQFPDSLRPLAYHLMRQTLQKYFVTSCAYHQYIQQVGESVYAGGRGSVCCCIWQPEGKSASGLAHKMKNQFRWNLTTDIDLRRESSGWPKVAAKYFVICDDFVGSGKTILSLFEQLDISRIFHLYPQAEIKILILVAFEAAIRDLREKIKPYSRISLAVGRILDNSDKCFSVESKILTNEKARADVSGFCVSKFKNDPLGYGDIGALVVFPDTVPNNSLPILWRNHPPNTWKPLFPASGLPLP